MHIERTISNLNALVWNKDFLYFHKVNIFKVLKPRNFLAQTYCPDLGARSLLDHKSNTLMLRLPPSLYLIFFSSLYLLPQAYAILERSERTSDERKRAIVSNSLAVIRTPQGYINHSACHKHLKQPSA